jgi:hypothetical protein
MKIKIGQLAPGGDRAPRGLRQEFPAFFPRRVCENPHPPVVAWTVVYDHEDCEECKGRVDSALAMARARGTLSCYSTVSDFKSQHGARVTRSPSVR